MHQLQTGQQSSITLYLTIVLLAFLYAYRTYRKASFHSRLSAVRNRPLSNLQPNKIVVALELEGLFVQISQYKRDEFQQIHLSATGFSHLILRTKELFGIGLYYKRKMSIKIMRALIHSLNQNPKIELFLYTRIPLPAANLLLEQLCLNNYFRVECRRSCNQKYCERLKHPTEVDENTQRVVIITNSDQDYLEEDSKYFMVAREGELAKSVRLLTKVVNQNEELGELHNELAEEKIRIECDYKDSQ